MYKTEQNIDILELQEIYVQGEVKNIYIINQYIVVASHGDIGNIM